MSDEIAPATESAPRPWRTPAVAAAIGLLIGAGGVGAAWSMSTSTTTSAAATISAVPAVSTSASASAAPFDLSGTLTIATSVSDLAGTACKGGPGYDDIVSGAAVTVYDAGGMVVGTDSLNNGHYVSGASGACVFAFTVQNVPNGAKFYQVEISHRGKLSVSANDAKTGAFTASLG